MMDSARLAGLMSVFDHSKKVQLTKYCDGDVILRSPVKSDHMSDDREVNPNNVTLDQIVPVLSSLEGPYRRTVACGVKWRSYRAQNIEADASGTKKPWWNGPDIATPPVREFVNNIIYNTRKTFWLTAAILFHAYVTPMAEPHQLICIIQVTDKSLFKLWTKHNKKWQECLLDYWGGWRQEREFGEFLIERIKDAANSNN